MIQPEHLISCAQGKIADFLHQRFEENSNNLLYGILCAVTALAEVQAQSIAHDNRVRINPKPKRYLRIEDESGIVILNMDLEDLPLNRDLVGLVIPAKVIVSVREVW